MDRKDDEWRRRRSFGQGLNEKTVELLNTITESEGNGVSLDTSWDLRREGKENHWGWDSRERARGIQRSNTMLDWMMKKFDVRYGKQLRTVRSQDTGEDGKRAHHHDSSTEFNAKTPEEED